MDRRTEVLGLLAMVVAACGGAASSGDPADAGLPADAAPPVADGFFASGTFHQIEIEVAEADLDALEWDREGRVPCRVVVDGEVHEAPGIRQKSGGGSWSWLGGKPGFSLRLDEYGGDGRVGGLHKLLLNNAKQDPGLLDAHLSYEVFRRAGLAAPRTTYGIVSLNQLVYGIYLIEEPVDEAFMVSHYGPEQASGNLYEGICCVDFVTNVPFLDAKQEGPRDDLAALAAVILDTPDAGFGDAVAERLDLPGFLTYYALEALLDSPDSYSRNLNNYYLYAHPDGRFRVLPHGMDRVFEDVGAPIFAYRPLAQPVGRLSQRIREIPALDARWRTELIRIATEAWDVDGLLAVVDDVDDRLHRTPPPDQRTAADLAAFDAAVGLVRATIVKRKGMALLAGAVCGDGVLAGAEECDDGDLAADDGCDAACITEECGDGRWQPGIGEACDGVGCNLLCDGAGACGNGDVELGEACDYGPSDPDDDCSDACQFLWCGDGVTTPGIGEACDGAGCRRDCADLAVCGDGVLDADEDCDDGGHRVGDGCGATCRFEDCVARSHGGEAYAICPRKRDRLAARATCESLAGTIAVPRSLGEDDWLAGELAGLGGVGAWLGIEDEGGTGVWVDPAGEPIGYTRWAPGNPTPPPQSRCALLDADGGRWTSVDCALLQAGVACEVPAPS